MPYSQIDRVATNSRVEVAPIPFRATLPDRHILTVGAEATANATTLSLSADTPMDIRDGQRIDFADGSYAIVAVPAGSDPEDVFTIADSATDVPVQPLAGTVGAATTGVTKFKDMGFEVKAIADLPYVIPYRWLLGATAISPVPTTATVDTSAMDAGFGATTAAVGNDLVITVNTNVRLGDRAAFEVVDPIVHDISGIDIQRLVWVKCTLSDGTIYEGPTRPALTGADNTNRQQSTRSYTFTMQGNSYSYISGDETIFGT